MMNSTLFRVVGIWILFVVVAKLNAVIREQILTPMIGQGLALPFSGVLLSILIFLITLGVVPFLNIYYSLGFWRVGIVWVLLTLIFEFVLGHCIIGNSWDSVLAIFNITEGNFFILVLLITAFSPYIAAKIRALIWRTT